MNPIWNKTSSFIVPVGVLFVAMAMNQIPFDTPAAYAVVIAFMTLKIVVQYFKFEPGRAIFAGVGRETRFLVYTAVVYSLLALGTVKLFMLATS